MKLRLKRRLQLFHACCPLEFITLTIFRLLPPAANGNWYKIVMTDRVSKLTRAMQTVKTSSPHVANVFSDSRIVFYSITAHVVTDNGVRFTTKLYAMLCTMLGVEHLTTTAYYHQTNEQAKQNICKIETRLWHYVAENQNDCDKYVQP